VTGPAATGPVAGELRARQPKAIHSALSVLEEVARCGPGVTAREVSDNLALPRATAYRLLNLLVQDEYLVRMPDLRGFALGRKVVELANLVAPAAPPEAVRDVIERLRARIRGGVHLVRYEQDGLRIIDGDPDFPPNEAARTRRLDGSAMGRLLLAERAAPGRDIAADPGLLSLVAEVRLLGYARQIDAVTAGYGCIAVPIRDRSGTLVAGLCLSAPRLRIEEPAELLELLRTGARELGPLLA
jgi:DNA-binding IclR family transcriptional regulator